jgi:DNA helicase-2/ATP-dependent DNA helicase PcrA
LQADKHNLEQAKSFGEKTIEDVINEAHENGICIIDDKLS